MRKETPRFVLKTSSIGLVLAMSYHHALDQTLA